jgi:hypothetical protein
MDRYWLPRWLMAGSMALCIYVLATAKVLPQEYPNCTEFGFQISGFCCCTNDRM